LETRLGLSTAGEAGHDEYASLVSVRDIAKMTGFSVHTIRDWCEQDLLPAKKISNRWRLERNRAIMAIKNLNRRRRKRRGQDST